MLKSKSPATVYKEIVKILDGNPYLTMNRARELWMERELKQANEKFKRKIKAIKRKRKIHLKKKT